MSKLVLCPFHNDTRPSMRLYSDWAHCYVCSAHIPVAELQLPATYQERQAAKEPTNVPNMINYINSLELRKIRGLMLPSDDRGFFVKWPMDNYYKRRNYTGKTRYIAPSGVKPPLFVYPGDSNTLVIVEGELNAMSLHSVLLGDYKICSPGPASDMLRHIRFYIQFYRIHIFVDKDAPGVVFGCQLREHLLKLGKKITLTPMLKDFNQILQDNGQEAVKQLFEQGIL